MGVSDTYKSIIRPPDLVVYLQCSTNVAINRIIRRGRVSELKAPMEYWFQLNEAYEKWYNWYRGSKKILINVDDIDFVSDYEEEDYTIDSILESLI
jgi:deoxyadenosine/deoxycytidine kinase